MKPSLRFVILAAVFLTATFVTAFALTLNTPAPVESSGFIVRCLENAARYGWAAGASVALLFVLVLLRR